MRIVLLELAACASAPSGDVVDAKSSTDAPVIVADAARCDLAARPCSELGASFTGGTAPPRADCRGWDPTGCALAQPGSFEAVKPASRDPRWVDARCNDGSPFAFVVRMATPRTDDWVIYLEGGVYCDDYSYACAQRDPYLRGTLPFADRSMGPIPITGIVGSSAAANPDFANANQVLAHYCSSDFWAGASTTARPTSGGTWYFAGRAHVRAMLDILAERYGLDDQRDSLRVLFGGGSAGAFGAHFNVEQAIQALPRATLAKRLKLLVDAGWMTDWDHPQHRIGGATTSDRDVWSRARTFWSATFDPVCESQTNPLDCFFGPAWYPYVAARVPTFVQQSSVDQSFMAIHGVQPGSLAAQTWRTQTANSLAPVSWLFSGAQSYHILGVDDSTMSYGPANRPFKSVLGAFWQNAAPQRVVF